MTESLMTAALPGYLDALQGAALADERAAGRIFMRGRDRAELLHRLSTNDIKRLRPGQGCRSVLTSPIGRIIDLLVVHALEEALLILTGPDQGPAVFGHLRKNIFFSDQVTLEPAGRSHGQLALYGPAATDLLTRLGAAIPADLPRFHGLDIQVAGLPVRLICREPIGGQGWALVVPAEHMEPLRAALLAAGAAPLDGAAFDILRVEQGYGAFGRELSQEYIPLETGLTDAVSFTKGCYVGQEIIARMESRNRLAKQLRGLRLDQPVAAPAALLVAGKDAGNLTSAVVSPRLGPIGLAYVRSAHAEPGSRVEIAGSVAQGEVVTLPFDGVGV